MKASFLVSLSLSLSLSDQDLLIATPAKNAAWSSDSKTVLSSTSNEDNGNSPQSSD